MSTDLTLAEILPQLREPQEDGKGGYFAFCPCHADGAKNGRRSLHVTPRDGKVLFYCFAGCKYEDILKKLNLNRAERSRTPSKFVGDTTGIWSYKGPDGELRYQVLRYRTEDGGKTYRFRRPNGQGGWIKNMKNTPRIPYRLPDLVQARQVFIVEGEKCADRLAACGVVATTNPEGAGKWHKYRETLTPHFEGKDVVILPDNDEPGRKHALEVAQALHGVAASVKVVDLPGLPNKGDIVDWLDAGHTVEELRALVGQTTEWASTSMTRATSHDKIYEIADGCIVWRKSTNNGDIPVRLCNFAAQIVGEEVRDDGAEQKTMLAVEGTLKTGRILPRRTIPAERFQGMGWVVTEWGAGAVISAGQAIKDRLREAVQVLSDGFPRRVIFTHIGWREIDGRWCYLHAGGAIGADGPASDVEVGAEDAGIRDYKLVVPATSEELTTAVEASLSFLNVADDAITVPLLASTYRAPLGEALKIDFSVFTSGPTGCQKTEITALVQAHYGARFNGRCLPGNWSTTANSLEKQAFLAKDAVFVVDDFAPGGTSNDIARLHRDADRLLRAQGNTSGRGRMRPDGSLRPSYFPRGLILSSGEDVPRGHSLRARLLVVEMQQGDVDLKRLSKLQRAAGEGVLAGAMAGYVRWLAPQIGQLKKTLLQRRADLRDLARKAAFQHDRMPDQAASLMVGWELLVRFARESGAVDEAAANSLHERGWDALLKAAGRQVAIQGSEDPVTRFIELLIAAITSGKAHLAEPDEGERPADAARWGWRQRSVGKNLEWQPLGDCVGWTKDDDIILEPDAAFATVQRIAREQGEAFPVTQRTLWKRLAERRLMASTEDDRNMARMTIMGKRRRVIHLSCETLSPGIGPIGPTGATVCNSKELRSEVVGLESGQTEESGQRIGPDAAPRPLERPEKVPRKPGQTEESGHEYDTKSQSYQGNVPIGPIGPEMEQGGAEYRDGRRPIAEI